MKQEEGMIQTSDGLSLFTRNWLPEGAPKAHIVLLHGLAEHSGRYYHVAQHLVEQGYAIYSFDGRGHGKSEGHRCYIPSLDHYIADIAQVVAQATERKGDGKLFLFGHSMGGGFAALYATTYPEQLDGVLLSAPALKAADDISPTLIKLSGMLGRITPKLPVVKLDASAISRDQAVVDAYVADPLVSNSALPARTGAELLRLIEQVTERRAAWQLPVLLMHGTQDKLTNIDGSRALYENVNTDDKMLKIYEGLYHEILNEPEQGQVLDDIVDWLQAHL